MSDAAAALREEIEFLDDEIKSLRFRIGAAGNAVQFRKLDMMNRLRDRCTKSLKIMADRGNAT